MALDTALELLADFDAAANDFFEAFAAVPDAALGFRPEGDDYALSGLLIHVAGSMEHYAEVLRQMLAEDFQPFTVVGAADPSDAALTHEGITPAARVSTLERVRQAHAAVAEAVAVIGDVSRTAAVRFGESAEPLSTSATDVVGWVREHYREHIPHIDELMASYLSGIG